MQLMGFVSGATQSSECSLTFFFPFLPIVQNLIRDFEGIHIIAGFLSDPLAEVRVQTLNALNNLCMNIQNQEQIKVCCPTMYRKYHAYHLLLNMIMFCLNVHVHTFFFIGLCPTSAGAD